MALRDQPYLPLYIQDYLTDEKLNNCSASTQGVYIKIMCVFHKSLIYGGILLKQKDKQKSSKTHNFVLKLARLLPFDEKTISDALSELLEEEVLKIEGDFLFQKRMVHDNKVSESRSKAGAKGGGNPSFVRNLVKTKPQTKSEQNTEYENEDESDNDSKKGGVGEKTENFDPELPDKIYSELSLQQSWLESISMQFRTGSLQKTQEHLLEFLKTQNNGHNLKGRTDKDICNHFVHWMKKLQQLNNQVKNGKLTPDQRDEKLAEWKLFGN